MTGIVLGSPYRIELLQRNGRRRADMRGQLIRDLTHWVNAGSGIPNHADKFDIVAAVNELMDRHGLVTAKHYMERILIGDPNSSSRVTAVRAMNNALDHHYRREAG